MRLKDVGHAEAWMEPFASSVPDNWSETHYVSSLKIGCIFHDIHLFNEMLTHTQRTANVVTGAGGYSNEESDMDTVSSRTPSGRS